MEEKPLKCVSSVCTTRQHVSKIDESDVLFLPKRNKSDYYMEIGRISHHLIQTVSAAYKTSPHTDEATKEARAKLFFIWCTFGPPVVLFTISPGDEFRYRINLCLKNATWPFCNRFCRAIGQPSDVSEFIVSATTN